MIALIKAHFTIAQIAQEFFPEWQPARSCRSPFRKDQVPSFSVYNDSTLFMDFADPDSRGDVIDFYALARHITLPEATNELYDRLRNGTGHLSKWSHTQKTIPARKPTPADPFCLPYQPGRIEYKRMKDDCERLLANPETILAMVAIRGWKQSVIRELALDGQLGVSLDGCITFNYLCGSKSRWQDQSGKRQIRWNFGKPWFWRGELVPEADKVWIVEGETKLIRALCWNWEKDSTRLIALPSASFDGAPWAYLFSDKEICYVADPDSAGRKAAQKIMAALAPVAKSIAILYPQDFSSENRGTTQ